MANKLRDQVIDTDMYQDAAVSDESENEEIDVITPIEKHKELISEKNRDIALQTLLIKVRNLEQTVKSMQNSIRKQTDKLENQDKLIKRLENELKRKVSYEP